MIVKACAFAIGAAILSVLLKEIGWRGVPLVGVVASIGIIGLVLPYLSVLKDFYSDISDEFGLSDFVKSALKVIGVGYLGGICADVCSELGEVGAASAVVTVSRLEILILTAPYFVEVVEMGVSLLG